MTKVTITEGQSLVDVALQTCGTVAALFDLADANSLSITEVLEPGQELAVPASSAALPAVASYFSGRGLRINTGNEAVAVAPPTSSTLQWESTQWNNDQWQ